MHLKADLVTSPTPPARPGSGGSVLSTHANGCSARSSNTLITVIGRVT